MLADGENKSNVGKDALIGGGIGLGVGIVAGLLAKGEFQKYLYALGVPSTTTLSWQLPWQAKTATMIGINYNMLLLAGIGAAAGAWVGTVKDKCGK